MMLISLRFSLSRYSAAKITQTTDNFKFNPYKKFIREHPLLITNLFDFDRSGVESRSTIPPQFHSRSRAYAVRFNQKSKSLASLVPLRRFPINSSDGEELSGLLGRRISADRRHRRLQGIIFGRETATPELPSRVFGFSKRPRTTFVNALKTPYKFRKYHTYVIRTITMMNIHARLCKTKREKCKTKNCMLSFAMLITAASRILCVSIIRIIKSAIPVGRQFEFDHNNNRVRISGTSAAIKFRELYHGFEIRNPRNAEKRDGSTDGLRGF